MKISIITDGNNTLGMGHVYQSLTLASLLMKANPNLNIDFLTKSDSKICSFMSSFGYSVEKLDDDNHVFQKLKQDQPQRIIFDKLDVSPGLAKKIKEELKIKLIIFTNLTEANKYADMTVIADMGSNFKNVIHQDRLVGKIEFFGPKFWLLRPEFYELKKNPTTPKEVVQDIMLIFGGSDPSNVSSAVLYELMKMDNSFNILLVLGASFGHQQELDLVLTQCKSSKSKVTVVKNMKDVGDAMRRSDVVFASPGLSFFEALAVGTPVVGFHQDELQKSVYAEVLPTLDRTEAHKLPLIIKNKSFLYPQDPSIKAMEIGEGKDQLISEILK